MTNKTNQDVKNTHIKISSNAGVELRLMRLRAKNSYVVHSDRKQDARKTNRVNRWSGYSHGGHFSSNITGRVGSSILTFFESLHCFLFHQQLKRQWKGKIWSAIRPYFKVKQLI